MRPGGRRAGVVALAALGAAVLGACTSTTPGRVGGGTGEAPVDARGRLLARVEAFHVSGSVRTEDGLRLPEIIAIEVRSEICVESREPGSRFWSLDYDTCFTFVSIDTLDDRGEYAVSVPSLDADLQYESHHAFGDLRLVQRGPVSFLARSDAGWRHQETFTSSRNQRRDLVLTLETDVFWVVAEEAHLRARPNGEATVLDRCGPGTGMEVIRFHQGWAECVRNGRIGWMEMRFLGTEREMDVKQPARGTPETP